MIDNIHEQMINQLLNTTFTAQQEFEMELELIHRMKDLKQLAETSDVHDDAHNDVYVFEL